MVSINKKGAPIRPKMPSVRLLMAYDLIEVFSEANMMFQKSVVKAFVYEMKQNEFELVFNSFRVNSTSVVSLI